MEAPLFHLALVGTPNSGKTALFNALTGSRQKVANYPGVTVERKQGGFVMPSGRQVSLIEANEDGIGQRTRPAGYREATAGANARTVWTINPRPFPGAHGPSV